MDLVDKYLTEARKIKTGEVVITPEGEAGYVFNWWREGARVVRLGQIGLNIGKEDIPEEKLKGTGIDINSPLGDVLSHAKDKKSALKIVQDRKILSAYKQYEKEFKKPGGTWDERGTWRRDWVEKFKQIAGGLTRLGKEFS